MLVSYYLHELRRAIVPSWKLRVLLLLGVMIVCACTTIARPQAASTAAIRVESNEVLVPAFVYTKDHGDPVVNLTAPDFRLFEDGKEQKIQQFAVERIYAKDFRNNFGVNERESAWTPGNKWSELGGVVTTAGTSDLYLLGYVPPYSAEGSCHEVQIKVDRKKDAAVVAGNKYCYTIHSPSDPLNGTKLSKEMEDAATSANAGKIPLSFQAGLFYADTKSPRVYITLEFPSKDIRYRPDPDGLRYEIGVLAMAYRKDGVLEARSSDIEEDNAPMTDEQRVSPGLDAIIKTTIPNHHEAQIELPPGDYDLRVVVSDGVKFGRAETRITVDSYDGKQLGISSIVLCKQFHEHKQTMPDPGYLSTLSDFVPLVSKAMEFTPTGDTRFITKDSLFAYYEVYEPFLTKTPATDVRIRVRIIYAQSGELKSDTGLRSAADWIQAGSSVIHVSQEVNLKELTKGSYRIEVQASDSAGRSTVWRTANFTIE